MENFNEIFRRAREASRVLPALSDGQRSAAITTLASLVDSRQAELLEANLLDLARMDPSNPLYDRLQLTPERLRGIASDLRHVAGLPTPVGEEVEHRRLPNGIDLRKVRVPFGVIGVIYEARPNVTFDVFSLCLKSGNACILKGGHDADDSNRAAIGLIHEALRLNGIPVEAATLLPSTHEATAAMLGAVGQVDVCIPRGGRRLIDFVRDNAKVPVIETGAGVVHAYFDLAGDLEMGRGIITNAKTRRVSVCNALDTLLVHRGRLANLPSLCRLLAEKGVEIHADDEAMEALRGNYPDRLLVPAGECWDTEWMDYKMGLRVVGSLDEAISHITLHGSGHSESIITADTAAADTFRRMVDASCVYVNLPTSFTDGAQFGLGAEIGISTQKLGPRGPMGLREITTTRYLLTGDGQLRP
ncbi:MAG: glutamate-5-semialdehyde dehydrogenase [Muribaculaceae bacterium]|nr:glutamate-5-semialdehyde dehydrogenase [Muribaculaceae bacterium]